MLVIKIGGAEGIHYDFIADDIAHFIARGERLVIVHGGSAATNQVAQALGHPPQFVTSVSGYTSRRTDRRTLEIFEMVYCGQMNKGWVERLQQRGVNAIGLSGLDGKLWQGTRKDAITILDERGRRRVLRDDYTGRVEQVNTALLQMLLDAGYTPVLTPPALSYQGEAINVDGDRAAAATAVALKAETLVLLSNVPGLLANFPDERSLIRQIAANRLDDFMTAAQDRMKKKVLGAGEAIAGGVRRVIFADGRVEQPIQRALAGEGTVIA
ncbi:MAG: [LysW]-aminoadipate kinase [Anaerolineae bacterium]|nr:[LysW]-aminoadipate kinase [Anaerolineae bacterium]MDW8070080.1 [LysW]-aminoadipate kinase [Anaerolineae bacterium]